MTRQWKGRHGPTVLTSLACRRNRRFGPTRRRGFALGGISVYHDSDGGAFAFSQRPARVDGSSLRFELFFESYEFQGSYLSLALSIPDHLRRPKVGEVLAARLDALASRRVKTFLRLNMKSVDASDVLHADGQIGDGAARFEFDMSFAAFEPGEKDQIWLDIIFDRPRMVELSVRGLTISLVPGGGS